MYVLGLTGGIATGKSTIAKAMAQRGLPIWDADAAAREVVKPGRPGHDALRLAFGRDFFRADGTLKRKALAAHVFGDVDQLRLLNQTVHPAILQDLQEHLARWQREARQVAVIDAPLLFETGIEQYCDEVWVASCGMDAQVDRLLERDGLDEQEAQRRIDAQMPDAERRAKGQRVIDTSGPVEDTARFVQVLLDELLEELGACGER